jgi:hemerythrin-like domain-containing protein
VRDGVEVTVAKRRSSKKSARRAGSRKRARTPAKRSRKTAKRSPLKSKTARRRNAARGAATRKQRIARRPAEPSTLASATTAVRGAIAGAVAAVAARMPGGGDDTDAIRLLETEHRRLEELLRQGEATTERAVKGRTQLLDTLTALLARHELIEEKILYPALQSHPEAREIVLEGFQEHHIADIIVKELHAVAKDDERWGAKFKVLKESIEHHIGEEEGEMFRTARAVLGRDELRALGTRMDTMRAKAKN